MKSSTPSQKSSTVSQVIASLDARSQRAIASYSSRLIRLITERERKEFRLTDADKVRIIRWVSWSRRLRMDIDWILDKVFEWGWGVASSKIKYRRNVPVLPVAIAVLTGPACYAFVEAQAALERGKIDEESSTVSLRSRMLDDTMERPVVERVSGPLDYETMDAFSDAYQTRINTLRSARQQAENILLTSKPFRGNPFR